MLVGLTELQHDSLRRTIATDVTIAMAALHVLGIVVLDREANSAGLTELGRYAVRRVRGMAQPGDPVLQVRITFADVDDPPVWRRVAIPASYTLDRVHAIIQASMGWEESHLHMFRIKGREYGPAYLDAELETLDESQFRIGDLMKPGDPAGYEVRFRRQLGTRTRRRGERRSGCRHRVPGVHRRRGRMPARGLRRPRRLRRPQGPARRAAWLLPRSSGPGGGIVTAVRYPNVVYDVVYEADQYLSRRRPGGRA